MNDVEIVKKICKTLNTDTKHLISTIHELEKKVEEQKKKINELEKSI